MRVRCVKHYLRLDRLSTFEKQTSGGIPCACCLLGTSCRFWMCKNSKIRRMQEDCSLLESRLHWYLDMSPAGRRRSANIVLLCFFNFKCHQQLPTKLEASTLPLRWTKFYLRQRAGTSWMFPSPNFLIFEPQHRISRHEKKTRKFQVIKVKNKKMKN